MCVHGDLVQPADRDERGDPLVKHRGSRHRGRDNMLPARGSCGGRRRRLELRAPVENEEGWEPAVTRLGPNLNSDETAWICYPGGWVRCLFFFSSCWRPAAVRLLTSHLLGEARGDARGSVRAQGPARCSAGVESSSAAGAQVTSEGAAVEALE
ncbi:hypothetical protein NL108_002834 [Boleophthalmus pectinirostris]|nr:hypothetical protein NL108_002834 [Boleophthalmus pectinirostris]